MRRLVVSAFASLDGILQAPGGPEEDPTGGFGLGGWRFGFADEGMDIPASGFHGKDRELVLGRGKRLFGETARPSALRLVRSRVSTTGVVMSTYVPGGEIRPGSFASARPPSDRRAHQGRRVRRSRGGRGGSADEENTLAGQADRRAREGQTDGEDPAAVIGPAAVGKGAVGPFPACGAQLYGRRRADRQADEGGAS